MKKLSNLKGAKTLSKKEQQSINGGTKQKCVHSLDEDMCPTNYPYYCGFDKCCDTYC